MANWLRSVGVTKGDSVAIYMPMVCEVCSGGGGDIAYVRCVCEDGGWGGAPLLRSVMHSPARQLSVADGNPAAAHPPAAPHRYAGLRPHRRHPLGRVWRLLR